MARIYKSRMKAEQAANRKNKKSRKAKYDVETRFVIVRRKSLIKRFWNA